MRFLIHRKAMWLHAEDIVAKPSKSLLLLIENSNASCAPDIECMQCSIQYNHIRFRRERPGRFGNRLHALQVHPHKRWLTGIHTGYESNMLLTIYGLPMRGDAGVRQFQTGEHAIGCRIDFDEPASSPWRLHIRIRVIRIWKLLYWYKHAA